MVRTHPKQLKRVLKDVRKLSNREFIRITKKASKLDDVERLKKLYYDPKEPGSFGGVKRWTEASGLKKSRVKLSFRRGLLFTSFSCAL
ncbi:hypothetical protein TNCT_300681 [Trichonephila clavata]|uniref:Uncharacterized protein n=1 Tax=Trichonephila clavata TaxID=2740835 RepID=A0A8X6HK81_TRICU|nr:hypothetical protein TNCT_300681 [Trichonephila clavata]